ncbi:MAG: NADH:ubiquinone reductase (Na(+)-transporting) subunit A [Hyphomicrobiales bacterium]|nr:MAG: NADH:ubiquinone reductase (Na(+)-transporting) subunit A [Hyphomicrobiales bacterium]
MKLKKGLDLPIIGAPNQIKIHKKSVKSIAVNGQDYIGLKPKMLVAEGEHVKCGQPLFEHKVSPEIKYVAPASGVIKAINRGPRRVLETIIIELDDKQVGVNFDKYKVDELSDIGRNKVQKNLYKSGLWSSFKTRPYSKVPTANTTPHSLFVTAMDSEPLAADAASIIHAAQDDFDYGIEIINQLSDGKTFICHDDKDNIGIASLDKLENVEYHHFSGPHPSGLAGTHIHFLDPIFGDKTIWTIGYQDVIAIGRLFTTGMLNAERIIAITGPSALAPKLVKTQLGANIDDLLENEVAVGKNYRAVSGSVLTGYKAEGKFAYLGRYHRQICLLDIDESQELLGWLRTSTKKYAFNNVHLSSFFRKKLKFPFSTKIHGSPRALVPFGSYERVMPMDILTTQLLRAILIKDTDSAQKLGVMEFDEEDLALCSFICHSKYEYGEALRACLEKIEKEG